MKKYLLLVLAALFIAPTVSSAQDLRITEFNFATAIEKREPMGVDTTFAADVGNVYCFTQIEGAKDTTQIAHVWYYKGQEKARINLDIESDNWRTWSSKTILKNWTGRWRVLVEDPQGNVLGTKNFVISK